MDQIQKIIAHIHRRHGWAVSFPYLKVMDTDANEIDLARWKVSVELHLIHTDNDYWYYTQTLKWKDACLSILFLNKYNILLCTSLIRRSQQSSLKGIPQMTLVRGDGIVRKFSGTQQKDVSSISIHRINTLGFNMCLRKDWKALTILWTASQQSENLYNSSESWNHRILELKNDLWCH